MIAYFTCIINNYSALIQTSIFFMQTIILLIGLIVAWRQLSSLRRQLQGNSLQQIQSNDREIKTLMFNNPSIVNATTPNQKAKLRIFLGLVINHAKHIFIQKRLKHIPDEYWIAVDRDMTESVKHELFQRVWKDIREFQPEPYQQYVDQKIEDSIEELKQE